VTDVIQPAAVPDRRQAALEASCDALIALQLVHALSADAAGELRSVVAQTNQAIELLRSVIDGLRLTLIRETTSIAQGFVLHAPGQIRVVPNAVPQSKPRRTA
jgi:hypothetical protein